MVDRFHLTPLSDAERFSHLDTIVYLTHAKEVPVTPHVVPSAHGGIVVNAPLVEDESVGAEEQVTQQARVGRQATYTRAQQAPSPSSSASFPSSSSPSSSPSSSLDVPIQNRARGRSRSFGGGAGVANAPMAPFKGPTGTVIVQQPPARAQFARANTTAPGPSGGVGGGGAMPRPTPPAARQMQQQQQQAPPKATPVRPLVFALH